MTQIPWRSDKLLVWDVTVVNTLTQSYVCTIVRGRGKVAELAADIVRKVGLPRNFHDIRVPPNRCRDLGPMNESAYLFFEDLGMRICDVTGDIRKVSFIFQRLSLSVTIQRFNAALYRETFVLHGASDL